MTSSVKVLQVSNISPNATKDQIQALFAYIGKIEECKIYPSTGSQNQPKFGYIKFDRETSVELGQHLTNVVFIDRALTCIPAPSNKIPDEETALRAGPSLPGQRQLPPNVTNETKKDADGQEMIHTNDPTISSLGLAPYPALPASTELSKVEEIRRTVYIGNLEKGCEGEPLMQFLNATIGEVMYLRMAAGSEHLPCDYAYVEFSNQESVPIALQNNGIEYNGRALKIQHSRVAIIKPKQKTTDQAMEEVEEAIRNNESRGDAPSLGRSYSPADRGSFLRRRSRTPPARRRSRTPPPRRRSPSPPIRRRRSPSYDERRERRSGSNRKEEKSRRHRDSSSPDSDSKRRKSKKEKKSRKHRDSSSDSDKDRRHKSKKHKRDRD